MNTENIIKSIAAVVAGAIVLLQGISLGEINQAIGEVHELHNELFQAIARQKEIFDILQKLVPK